MTFDLILYVGSPQLPPLTGNKGTSSRAGAKPWCVFQASLTAVPPPHLGDAHYGELEFLSKHLFLLWPQEKSTWWEQKAVSQPVTEEVWQRRALNPQLTRPKSALNHTTVLLAEDATDAQKLHRKSSALFLGFSSPSSTACSQQNHLYCTQGALPPSTEPQLPAPTSYPCVLEFGAIWGLLWWTQHGEHLISALCLSGEHGNAEEAPAAVISCKPLQREVTVVLMFKDRHTQPGVTHHLGYL